MVPLCVLAIVSNVLFDAFGGSAHSPSDGPPSGPPASRVGSSRAGLGGCAELGASNQGPFDIRSLHSAHREIWIPRRGNLANTELNNRFSCNL